MVAFHGFGQTGKAFSPVALVHPEYTIYALDLPFHGKTSIFQPKKIIEADQITAIIDKLIEMKKLERFSLAGFSIGCKFIFPLLLPFESKIDQVWLFAPDGIKERIWYQLATSTAMMRTVFRQILAGHFIIQRLITALTTLGLVSKNNAKIALKSMNSDSKRERLYHTWIALRRLKIDHQGVIKVLNKSKILVTVILSTDDNIIKSSGIYPFVAKIDNMVLETLSCPHDQLISDYAKNASKSMD